MAVRKRFWVSAYLIVLMMTAALYGCDYEIAAASLELVGMPNRIIYIADVDTEVDLSGLKLVETSVGGFVTEELLENWKNPNEVPGRLIYHEIDFAIPGVYEVELYIEGELMYGWRARTEVISLKFYIQVVDAEAIIPQVSD